MNKKNTYILIASILTIVIVIILIVCLIPKNYKVGDTIKTNNIELTLKKAQFAKKLQSGGYNDSFIPFTSSKNSNNRYREADKGHTFLSFSIKVKNISKLPIFLEKEFNDNNVIVEYKGTKYYSTNQSCEKNCYESGYAVWKNKKGMDIFKSFNYMSYELKPKEELKDLRIYLDIPIEVKDLKDSFKLIFEFDKNNETKDYTFKVK